MNRSQLEEALEIHERHQRWQRNNPVFERPERDRPAGDGGEIVG